VQGWGLAEHQVPGLYIPASLNMVLKPRAFRAMLNARERMARLQVSALRMAGLMLDCRSPFTSKFLEIAGTPFLQAFMRMLLAFPSSRCDIR